MLAADQLDDAARAMIAAASHGRAVLPVLEARAPHVCRQIASDAKTPGLLRLWGRSLNVDENVGQTIVDPAILAAIGSLAGVPMVGRAVHAGLQHTYGYLFATIATPYGAKRDRWLSPAMEHGFGLSPSLLGHRPATGTLLANATWLFGQIAFRDRPAALRQLQRYQSSVAAELVALRITDLECRRIVEEFSLPGRSKRQITLVTDLVRYPHAPSAADAENTLLVYSLRTGARSTPRLITGFPVTARTVAELQESVPARGLVDVRPQYNAYLPGWRADEVRGRRYFAEEPS